MNNPLLLESTHRTERGSRQAARLCSLTIFMLIGLASGQADRALADVGQPKILPPQSRAFGKTYSEWATAWWQWASSIPAPINPLLDQTGQFAGVGQSGQVFFLAGALFPPGEASVQNERACTVPAGKALFFPLLNGIYIGYPCDGRNLAGCEADQALEQANDIATLLSFLTPTLIGTRLSCEIDGRGVRDLQNYLEESANFFSINLPEDNVFSAFGVVAGPYHPCVDVGYYLMVAPLRPGSHTIHFQVQTGDGSMSLEEIWHLTVLPGSDEHD